MLFGKEILEIKKSPMSTLSEMKAEWAAEDEWRKEHYVQAFFIETFEFFRYTIPRHYEEAVTSVKYGLQRMFRGYDDYDVWSHYSANAERTIKVLKRLRETKVGAPHTIDLDGVLTIPDIPSTSEGVDSTWFDRWDEAIGMMIEGFEALLAEDDVRIEDANGDYDHEASQKERDRLWEIWLRGAKLYIANYRGLWD